MARLRSSLIGLFVTLFGRGAYAEHCHPDAPDDAPGKTKLSAKAEFANYVQRAYEGSYESLGLGVSHDFELFALSAEVPAYRLVRNGEVVEGLGDVTIAIGAPLPFEGERKKFGFALHTSLPTGNSEKGLGMGHVMFMPAAWFRFDEEPFTFDMSLEGGFALMNAGGSHSMHGPKPIVNPMNGQELTFQLTPRYAVHRDVRLKLRVTGAYPISDGGTPRLLGGVGVEFPLTSFFSNIEISTALVGDPYREKLSLGVGGIF